MAAQSTAADAVSAAFFCPQNRPPKLPYMEFTRQYLRGHPAFTSFVQSIIHLPDAWKVYAQGNAGIAALEQGPKYTGYFRDWIQDGDENSIDRIMDTMSGIIALPLLTILQIAQYFQYLEARGITHNEFLQETSHGGLQGFCGGLLPVMAIASSSTEEEVVQNAAVCLRIALGIGAYGELGDDPNVEGPTTVAIRLKDVAQAEEIVSKYPSTYVSAITEPLSVSIVGPTLRLREIKKDLGAQGVTVTELFLRGKVHNPENKSLYQEMSQVIDNTPELQLPSSDALRVPVRANTSGKVIGPGVNLAHEIARSTLVYRCEWYTLLESLAEGLRQECPGQIAHQIAMFGTGNKNIVSPMPFEKQGLDIKKQDVVKYVEKSMAPNSRDQSGPDLSSFPADSIAIIGVGCRLPGANSLDELWDNVLSRGAINAKPLPATRVDAVRVPRNAQSLKEGRTWYGNFLDDVESFDNTFFGVSPREALNMDPQHRLLLETAYEALDDSGYLRHHRREDFDRVGCFVGSTYIEYLENTNAYNPTAYTATGTIRAMQSGKISYHFGWSGPSEVIDTACSSSLVAIHRACRAIQAGECPMALAGGVNIITGINNYLDLGKAGFLSHTGQCKPFDATADGYCRADGVGLVVLKSLRQAVGEGDQILGVIRGIATNQGGLSPSITVPHDRAQVELFSTVLGQSGMSKEQVSYIEAHGTGTQVGDPIEISSLRHVFGSADRPPLHVGSLKANVGHSESAAGVGSLVKVLAMLQRSEIPPLAGFKALNPKIPDLRPSNMCIDTNVASWDAPVKAALVNSYGASGSNSALLCSEAPKPTSASHGISATASMQYPILLSAENSESLQAFALKLVEWVRKVPTIRLGDLAYTLYERRKHHQVRWVGTHSDLDTLAQGLQSGLTDTFEVAPSAAPKPVVLVFSGQSKQTIQLDPSWYRSFPQLRTHLEECNRLLVSLGYPAVLPVLFQSEPIKDVVALQCGTFAVQYACARCWIDAGVPVEAVIGHSFGELTAMAVSGVLSLEDSLSLVAKRASLMQTKWGSERGTMMAVHTDRKIVEDLVAAVEGLEIACFNGPRSQVVVGTAAAIEQAQMTLDEDSRFASQKIKHQRVNTSHGFHSVFTEPMLGDINEFANKLDFRPSEVQIETCTETSLDTITSERIAKHTREPVYFENAISRIEERLGSCIFLEAGFGSPIIPMAKKAIQNPSHHVFIAGSANLAAAAAALWREGVSASFWAHLPTESPTNKAIWLPPYQFRRQKHWLTYADYNDKSGKTEGHLVVADTKHSPMQLVTPRGRSRDSWASLTFDIHPTASRFIDVVSGHAVRNQPLCPASMYLECAVMAAKMIEPGLAAGAIRCENISFQGGLGLNPNREVTLDMEGAGEYLSWNFAVNSASKQQKGGRLTTHAKGRLSITSPADWQMYSRVIADRAQSLRTNPEADRITANRAYTLFSRVVTYDGVMRGIQQVFMMGNQAVADVRRPAVAPRGAAESSAVQICDSVALDTFIQVSGLLVNSSDTCPVDEVYIATKIDNLSVQGCDFTGANDQWVVYIMTTDLDETRIGCDVFVLDTTGKLVVTVSGVQFTRIPILRLEKILLHSQINVAPIAAGSPDHSAVVPTEHFMDEKTAVASAPSTRQPAIANALGSDHLRRLGLDSLSTVRLANKLKQDLPDIIEIVKPVSAEESSPERGSSSGSDSSMMRSRQRVIELISENSGSSLANIEDTVALQDIGIDSLSIVELKSSLEDAFGKQFSPDDMILESTLREILELVDGEMNAARKMHGGSGAAVHFPSAVVAF